MASREIWYGRISRTLVVKYEVWQSICDWGQGDHDPYCCKETIYVYRPTRNDRGGITRWNEIRTRMKDMDGGALCNFEKFMGSNRFQREWPSYGCPCVLNANAYSRVVGHVIDWQKHRPGKE